MKIALPIETKVREFRGKLWLALNLIKSGHIVILGNITLINKSLDYIEPDLYFGDSAYYHPSRERLYRQIQESGGKVLILDTEGGIFRSDTEYKKRLSPQILQYVDYFLAWGRRPAEIVINERELANERVRVTGNPRFDLLQQDFRGIYDLEAQKHRKKYNDYILINTNFTIANPFDQENLETNDSNKHKYQSQLKERFIEAIKCLRDDLSRYTYIVRPHPSENHEEYRNKFQSYSNIKVRHKGDVLPWIYGAKGVIHNSCTTGVESALVETPVISYRPLTNQKYDLELPNIVSREIFDYDELNKALSNIDKDSTIYQMNKKQRASLQQYLYNVDSRAATEITSIIDEIDNTDTADTKYSKKPPIEQRIKRTLTFIFGIRFTEKVLQSLTERDYSYMRQKFQGLSSKELQRELQNMKNHAQIPSVSVTHRRHLGDVFTLSKEGLSHNTAKQADREAVNEIS